jgi:hypothetical protein
MPISVSKISELLQPLSMALQTLPDLYELADESQQTFESKVTTLSVVEL